MSSYYYILKQKTNEYIYVGTGSYYDCHEDLIDILKNNKKNNVPLKSVQTETMNLYNDYDCCPVSEEALTRSWYYNKFIPAIYNWIDDSCILLCDYELNNYAKNYLTRKGDLDSTNDNSTDIITKDYTHLCLKQVASIEEDENDKDSIVDMGLNFSMAFNELLNNNTVYRKSVIPEVDYKLEDNKLYWVYCDDDKEKHYLNVIGIDLLFANDWLVK